MNDNNKELTQKVLNEIIDKIDYEKFLGMFSDKYNWLAFLGISEEDYQSLSLRVTLEKENNNTFNKKKVLTK